MGALRSRSGRLKKSERRRRLRQGEPGTVVLLDARGATVGREMGKSFGSLQTSSGRGRRMKTGSLLEFGFQAVDTLAYNIDARRLVQNVQGRLAEHYDDSLRRNVDADTGSQLPELAYTTKQRTQGRKGGRGYYTGKLLEHWGMSKVSGNPNSARGTVKLGQGLRGAAGYIAKELSRGTDFSSVRGEAAKVIGGALDEFMRTSKSDSAGFVTVEELRSGGWTNIRGRRL